MTIDWKSIETAPKDESLLLLYFPTGREDEDRYKIGFWSPEGDWFESEVSSSSLTAICGQPSHWARLNTP